MVAAYGPCAGPGGAWGARAPACHLLPHWPAGQGVDWQLAARYWFFWHLPAVSPEQDANRHAISDLTRALRYPTAEDKAEMYAGLNPQLTCNQAERTGGTSRSGSHMYEWVVSVSTHATTELRELLVPGGREWWSPGLLFLVCGRGGIA